MRVRAESKPIKFEKTQPSSSKPKSSSSRKLKTKLHNIQLDEVENSNSEASTVESASSSDSENSEPRKPESPRMDKGVQDTTVNNINSYAVPPRKPAIAYQAVKSKPKPLNWTGESNTQADKPCHTYVILGSCNKDGCPYNHTPKLRDLAIDKLVRDRATLGSDTKATTIHNMNLYHEVMDRPPSAEEYDEVENFCLSHSETSKDVEE